MAKSNTSTATSTNRGGATGSKVAAIVDGNAVRKVIRRRLSRPSLPALKTRADLSAGEVTAIVLHHGNKRPTSVAAYSANVAATGDENGDVILWDLAGGTKKKLKTHTGPVACVAIAGGTLLSGSYEGIVSAWKLTTNGANPLPTATPLPDFPGHTQGVPTAPQVWSVAVSRDGTRALSATNDGHILLWDTADATIRATAFASPEPVPGLAFVGPNGDKFLSGHSDGQMILWDISGVSLPGTPGPVNPPLLNTGPAFWHKNSHQVNSVAASPSGSLGVSASFDMTVKVWDLADNSAPLRAYTRHTNWVWRVAFSPNGDKVASASEDGTVRIWKVADVTDNQLPITETDGVMGVAFADATTVFFTAGGVSGVEAKRQGVNNP